MTAHAVDIAAARRRSRNAWLPPAILGLAAVEIGLGVWLPWNSIWPQPAGYGALQLAGHAFSGSLWLASAVVAYRRAPASRMWAILLAYVLVDWTTWDLQFTDSIWLLDLGYTYYSVATAVLVHTLVAFPTGELGRRGDRWLVAGVYLFTIGTDTLSRITDDRIWCAPFPCQTQPFFIWRFDGLGDVLGQFNAIAIPIIGVAVIVAVVRHWRAAGPARRRALGPAVAALPFAYISNVTGYVGDNLGIQALSDFGRTPVALALLAVVPLGIFVGVIRSQLSRGRIADLLVELGHGVPIGGLQPMLARAIGDPSLQIVYPASAGEGFVDSNGRSVDLPDPGRGPSVSRIESDGRTLAVLLHDSAVESESPGLVDAVGAAARLAIENERLAAEVKAQLEEVRASRARIAEAADAERRKVERDLHDGAQQRLVALTMRLEQARANAADSSRLIDDTTAELRQAIDEVRRLARGMHPPILTEAGLAAAVESLAEISPLPVTVRLPADRFPPAIEAAAYFVVAEALTNAGRYSGATSATVEGVVRDGQLLVTISDDGAGGADASRGSGLRGLADRVAAVGGFLEIDSPAGAGTRIRARFPLR